MLRRRKEHPDLPSSSSSDEEDEEIKMERASRVRDYRPTTKRPSKDTSDKNSSSTLMRTAKSVLKYIMRPSKTKRPSTPGTMSKIMNRADEIMKEPKIKQLQVRDQDEDFSIRTTLRVREATSSDTLVTKLTRLLLRERNPGSRPTLREHRELLGMCYRGDFEDLAELFERYDQIDVNYTDEQNRTGLYLGVMCGHFEVARVMVLHGADPNLVDIEYGRSVIHIAAAKGFNDILEVIVSSARKHPPIFDLKDKTIGLTPIMLATRAGRLRTVRYLVDEGSASIHHIDNHGWTALHYACAGSHTDIAEYLLLMGANIYAEDSRGVRPGDVNETVLASCKDVDRRASCLKIRSLILARSVDWKVKAAREREKAEFI